MKYPQIMTRVFRETWVIETSRHEAIQRVLLARLAGQAVSSDWDEPMDDETEDGRGEVNDLASEHGPIRIIPVYGILGQHLDAIERMCGGCSIDALRDQIELAQFDSNVAKVVFDFRSPGGAVTGIPECGDLIAEIGKPTIAFTDSQCCSGALWLAANCDEFYATRSSRVGSVGVYQYFEDWTRALDQQGITPNPISSGDLKLMGAYFKPMTKEERALFQAGCDKIYAEFKAVVNSKRPVAEEFLQGQVFDGPDAVAHGFVSGLVADLDECLQLASAM